MTIPARVLQVTVWTVLVLVLVVPTLLGLITPYVVVAIGIVALLTQLVRRQLPQAYGSLAARLFLLAFAMLAVLFVLTAQTPRDPLYVFNFTMLLLAGPFLLLFARGPNPGPAGVAGLAAAGVAVTLVMIGIAWLQGHDRPEGINLGPIVLSNATLALAVVATAGALAPRTRWSLALPLTLAAAVLIIVLTKSRGPLLAVLPLLVLSVAFLWHQRFRGSRAFWVAVGVVTAVVIGAGAVLLPSRIAALPTLFERLAGGGDVGDVTTRIRLALYEAGWRAFLDSPWIGHGWVRLMSSIGPYLDPAYTERAKTLPQLHNDVLDFAVAGGIVGIGVYLLILLAPLAAAWRSARDTLRPARLYATSGLAIVYAGGGLTDLMFGHEYHTMLFVMLNAVVLTFFRERPE